MELFPLYLRMDLILIEFPVVNGSLNYVHCWIFECEGIPEQAVPNIKYKKVLLRERKRHTAHCVARAHYGDLSGGGTPDLRWGTPSDLGLGTPPPQT